MVVDTSALLAIMLREPEAAAFRDLVVSASGPMMSVASVLEASLVLQARGVRHVAAALDGALGVLGIEIVPVSVEEGLVARDAFARFGRGRHPAGLNLGDCFAYALAKTRDLPLLYTGEGFAGTDVVPAWTP